MVNLSEIKYIKVSPGIGMARVGNSATAYIGPEAPGAFPVPNPPPDGNGQYKDKDGKLKPMMARFRVYGYNEAGEAIIELTDNVQDSGTTLNWLVHMANKKAANWSFQGQYGFDPGKLRNENVQPSLLPDERTQLHIDPGEKMIQGVNAGPIVLSAPIFKDVSPNGVRNIDFPLANLLGNFGLEGTIKVAYNETNVTIGTLTTDDQGRLLVKGGLGQGGSATTPPTVIKKGSNNFTTDATGKPYPEDNQPFNPDPNNNIFQSFNNSGWWDDIGGGSVHVEVNIPKVGKFSTLLDQKVNGSTSISPAQARGWVGVAPPKYAPTVRNVVSLLDVQKDLFPTIDPYAGTLELGLISGSNIEFLSSKTGEANSFTENKIATGTNQPGSLSLVSFKEKLFCAFLDQNSNIQIASAATSSGPFDFQPIKVSLNDQSVSTKPAVPPSIVVYNGVLYCAYLNEAGDIIIGFSNDGTGDSFDFRVCTPMLLTGDAAPTKFTVKPAYGICLVAYQGTFFMGFIGEDQQPYLGSFYLLTVPPPLPSETLPQKIFVQNISNGQAPAAAKLPPSVTVFDGRLYYAYTSSKNESIFGVWSNPLPLSPLYPLEIKYPEYPIKIKITTPPIAYSFQEVKKAPATDQAPALVSFNGLLYYLVVSTETSGGNGDREVYIGSQGPISYAAYEDEAIQILPAFSEFQKLGTSGAHQPAICDFQTIQYFRDIYPIFKTVTDYAYFSQQAFYGHKPKSLGNFIRSNEGYSLPNADNQFRVNIFYKLRRAKWLTNVPPPPFPTGPVPSQTQETYFLSLMPHLAGNALGEVPSQDNNPNQWLSLTRHQLHKFQKWTNGDFITGDSTLPNQKAKTLEEYPVAQQPMMANFGAFDLTVGGGLHPGIELTWYMEFKEYFCEPFRFAHSVKMLKPGFKYDPKVNYDPNDPAYQDDYMDLVLTPGSIIGYMSTPWHGDFWSCGITFWPPQRPNIVLKYDEKHKTNVAYNWFRSDVLNIPEQASENEAFNHGDNPDYFDGNHTVYQTFLRYWPHFGFLVANGKEDLNEEVRRESQRAPGLDNANKPLPPTSEINLNIQPALITKTNPGSKVIDYILIGRVVKNSGTNPPYHAYQEGITVKAFDKDIFQKDDFLGMDTTGTAGEFIIPFKSSDFSNGITDKNADIYFEVLNGTQQLNFKVTPSGSALQKFKGDVDEILIELTD